MPNWSLFLKVTYIISH